MPNKPGLLTRLQDSWTRKVEEFRHRLSYIDALPQLTVLGLISGIVAALLIVLFRLIIDGSLNQLLGGQPDNFESLAPIWRFCLPAAGAVVIGLGLHLLKPGERRVSVSHVLDRLHHHQGHLPFKNVLVQFFGGIASLTTGQSVGREGPAVHLGAGVASLMGQWLKLPNNSLRTLVGCGVAAAIAASFNTPMAGVIFAMEVVLMEYTITGFIPVIMASVSGAVISQMVFGERATFAVEQVQMQSLWELPFMALAGIIIALFAAAFLHLQILVSKQQTGPFLLRVILAGIITGAAGVMVPEVLGMGYDTVESAMVGQLGLQVLLVIVIAKLVTTAVTTGLGMPGGLIGPVLVIGGCLGGALGYVGNSFYPEQASSAGFYVVLGMAAMMGAVLNAPLAALIAVLELTYNPNIIFPSMVVIVVACVVAQQFFKCDGIFVAQLRAAGTPLRSEPDRQILSRVGVRSVMSTDFVVSGRTIDFDKARELLGLRPRWIVITDAETDYYLLRAADLAQVVDGTEQDKQAGEETPDPIDLREIPGQRFKMTPLPQRANLFEARKILQKKGEEVIFVERTRHLRGSKIIGVITPEMIDNYYSS